MICLKSTLLLFVLSGTAATVHAGAAAPEEASPAVSAEEQYFQMLEWRNVGPLRGGRSIAAAGSEARPREYYFGATGGGLWKTGDAGLSWRPVTDGQIRSSSVGAVAVAPSNPDVVYIGMGEGQLRANVLQGDGVYKSTDGGITWRHAGLGKTRTVTTIRVHPADPDLVYAAALGDPFRPNEERGIFRSRDGGESWEKILYRAPEAGAIDLAMDANDPAVLFATIWQVYRKPWQLWSGGPLSGMFKSTDGGDTWTEITRNPGLPGTVLGKMTVAVSPADSSRIYANIEAEDGGLYRSDDGGATWQWINGARKLWQRSFYFLQVRADPLERDTVYVLSFKLEKSTDGGETFSTVETRHVDIHDLWIDPANPERMIVADDGGASVTVNGGRTWTEQDYPTAQMYRVSTTNDFPYHICGAQQDSTSECVTSGPQSAVAIIDRRFTDAIADHYSVGTGESGYVVPHPAKSGVFFSGLTNGLQRFDRATGRMQDVQPFPYVVMGQTAASMKERWGWTYPIVFSPKPPHALYVGSQHVWRSLDEGMSWEKISPDLTRADPRTLGETGGPIMLDQDGPEVYATLYSLAVSSVDDRVIWTGSDDGLVHVSRNGGRDWRKVTPPDLPRDTRVSSIDLSMSEPGAAYVAAKRYEMGDRAPYAWKTKDFGRRWARIDGGFPAEEFLHVIRADPRREGLLYAGTEHGARVSFDDGESWRPLSLYLPDVTVLDVKVDGDDLVISTFGRSFYVLSGLSTLRQIPEIGPEEEVVLFAPGTAHRPVVPAAIDFYLSAPAEKVDVAIFDGRKTIRRLIDERPFPAGAHRVTWDLRHDGAVTFPGMILESRSPATGPLVVPGDYRVRLTADGVTATRDVRVSADPRIAGVEAQDYEEQLALALQVRDATSTANRLVIEIREMRAAIGKTAANATPARRRLADDVLARLAAVEAELYQVRNESPKDKIAYPIKLNDRLAGLQAFLSVGAGRPTEGQYAVFELLSEQLRELQARFEEAAALWEEAAGRSLEPLQDQRSADAGRPGDGHQPDGKILPLELVEQRADQAGARRAHRMAERNRAAVGVDLLGGPRQVVQELDADGGKGLVEFDEIDIVVCHAGRGQHRLHGVDAARQGEQFVGADVGHRPHACPRREAVGAAGSFGPQQHQRGAVDDRGRIPGVVHVA